jgi:hypothetical protein
MYPAFAPVYTACGSRVYPGRAFPVHQSTDLRLSRYISGLRGLGGDGYQQVTRLTTDHCFRTGGGDTV